YRSARDNRNIISIHDKTSAHIDELRYDNDEFLFPNGLRTGGTLSSDKVDVTGKITAKNADFTDRVKFLVNPSSNISVPYPSGASAFSVADNSGVNNFRVYLADHPPAAGETHTILRAHTGTGEVPGQMLSR